MLSEFVLPSLLELATKAADGFVWTEVANEGDAEIFIR